VGRRYSVAELAHGFGVSRTPVREALLMLEREGMVRFERNLGVRVLETTLHELEDIFGVRLLLEVPATRHACSRLTEQDLDELQGELDAMALLRDGDDEAAFMAHDQRFHEIILLCSGNQRLAGIVDELRDLTRLRGASTVGRSRSLAVIYGEHVTIMEALRARDATAAAAAMRAHAFATAALILNQEGVPPDGLSWAYDSTAEG
jgi:DNA-binding GntR family transcriptional regulator